MWKYLIPVIISVVIALFSDDIDKALSGNKKKVKKVILSFSGGVIVICMIAAIVSVLD